MTNSEEWYGKIADIENSILKERYGNMNISSSEGARNKCSSECNE